MGAQGAYRPKTVGFRPGQVDAFREVLLDEAGGAAIRAYLSRESRCI